MRVLVTGANGQLGSDVVGQLLQRGHTVVGTDVQPHSGIQDGRQRYVPVDLTLREEVARLFAQFCFDAVIHCAAWTAVDAAEEPQNAGRVYAVNVLATQYLAEQCRACGARLMYVSTDYVFHGDGTQPWLPDQDDYSPLNYYGVTKLEGERAVRSALERYFIVRTAWVFGKNGKNFVDTMLALAKTHGELRVVCDQIGTPTYTPDLARLLADMIETEQYGVYHATNEGGYISWYEFACHIFDLAGCPVRVIPVTTEEYGRSKAARPFNSRLDRSKLLQKGFRPLPPWEDALRRYFKECGYADQG